MPTHLESFERSSASVGVECISAKPEKVADAITDIATGPTVGVSPEHEDVRLPDTVAVDPTPAELNRVEIGVTPASFAVADCGSVALLSGDNGSELVSLYVDHYVAVVDERDIVPNMEAAFDRFDAMSGTGDDDVILATGPSATADMGALVTGAHGPSKGIVVVVED
ncbi:LUD domain-containing protein [Halocatena marina]|uniref:LUD domain-containing protein n=1 Tax=Halocatena marina TaxID=2934937 RepID=A0ABD5YXG3_9EURY|nr:LUD domain-containing protein [Halocatena marina]